MRTEPPRKPYSAPRATPLTGEQALAKLSANALPNDPNAATLLELLSDLVRDREDREFCKVGAEPRKSLTD